MQPLAIEPAELARWRASGKPHAVLDVREPWEVEIVGFPAALNIPLGQLPQRVAELPADRPVVVLCHRGARSLQATMLLRRQGMAEAVSLTGGIDLWARAVEPSLSTY